MSNAIDQDCPLCGRPAHYFSKDYDNRKHFFCGHCTEFELSRYAEDCLLKSAGPWQEAASQEARNAPEGTYYCLTRPTGDILPIDANAELVGRYVKRPD